MRLSKNTIAVLDNFSNINQSITLRPGNVISTGSPSLDVFARATTEDSIPSKVRIFNLKKFLGVLTMFKEQPDLEFNETHLSIASDRNTIEYTLAAEDAVERNAKESPDGEPKVPPANASFSLSDADLNQAMKAMSVLGLPNVKITVGIDTVTISGVDSKNSAKDKYSMRVGAPTWADGRDGSEFTVSIPRSNMKLLPLDYTVHAHEKYVKFEAPGIAYWIPALAG